MQAWWERDQIISAFIVGTFSMTAAMISMVVNSRRIESAAKKAAEAVAGSTQGSRARKKAAAEEATASPAAPARRGWLRRSRRLRTLRIVGMFVVGMVVGGLGYRVGANTLGTLGLGTGARLEASAGAVRTLPPLVADEPAASAAQDAGQAAMGPTTPENAASPAADVASNRLADWLRALGTRVYYRYAERLPEACSGAAMVHGSWDGGDVGDPVRCVDRAWLVFDLAPLLESGRVVPDRVYCFNFRDEAGNWAVHDPATSPGLEEVVMPVPDGALGGAPLGLRVTRDGETHRVAFATAAASSPC